MNTKDIKVTSKKDFVLIEGWTFEHWAHPEAAIDLAHTLLAAAAEALNYEGEEESGLDAGLQAEAKKIEEAGESFMDFLKRISKEKEP
jgi:hypothetical protein